MSEALLLPERIETVERGYEFLLAYAAQGRQDERGTELRPTLEAMHTALHGMEGALRAGFVGLAHEGGIGDFLAAVERDVLVARGAIAVVLSRSAIGSLLVDNLNASVHLRALLTDLFLIEQALRVQPAAG